MVTDAQKWLMLACIIAVGYLIYLLSPILTPFLISALLAYLGNPIIDRLQAMHLRRTFAVVLVFLLMLLILFCFLLILVPLLEGQLTRLIKRTPDIIDALQTKWLPWLSHGFGIDLGNIDLHGLRQSLSGHWQTIGNLLGSFAASIPASGKTVLLWLSYLLLIPVTTFYLLRDWGQLLARLQVLVPRRYAADVSRLTKDCNAVLAKFLRGQILVMLILGMIYSFGLWLAGIEFSILIGIGSGLVSFIPYLGFIVGTSIASIVAFMQFHDLLHIVFVLAVFGVGQAIEGMVLSPLLVGDRIGLHPVAVIFAVMAGAQLYGFFGMLLALPVAAVIMTLLRHAHERYVNSKLYKP